MKMKVFKNFAVVALCVALLCPTALMFICDNFVICVCSAFYTCALYALSLTALRPLWRKFGAILGRFIVEC